MNEWLTILQTFGLAVVVLLFLGACSWKAAPWVGENVIRPIVTRYVSLLDALIESVQRQVQVMEGLGVTLQSMNRVAVENAEAIARLHRQVAVLECVRGDDSPAETHQPTHPQLQRPGRFSSPTPSKEQAQ